MLTPYDELPHPASDHPHWRESWYLNFFDHEQELYGIAWMGVRPPQGTGEILFSVMQGNSVLHKFEDFAIPIPTDIGRERTGFGPLRWRLVEPYKLWEMDFQDEGIDVQLEWKALTPVYNWEWQDSTNSWHYQHPGVVTGTMKIGNRTFTFNGMGERDRAWGQRDSSAFRAVHWVTAQFPSGTHLEAMHMVGPSGDELYGFLHQEGVSELVSGVNFDISYTYPGGPPGTAVLRLSDRAGREFEVEQEVMNVVSMGGANAGNESRQYFTFNRYWLDGEPGYGMMDHWWSDPGALSSNYATGEPNKGRLFNF